MGSVCCLPEINLFFFCNALKTCLCISHSDVHRFVYAFGFVHVSPCVCANRQSWPTCPCLILSPALLRFYLPQLCESLEDLQNVNGQLRTEGQAIWSMMGGILGQVRLTFNRLILSLPCPSSFRLSPPHPILDPAVRLIYHSSSELTSRPDTNCVLQVL